MTDQHQPFDDDPELYEDDPELQGGTTHGQDEADDRATLIDDAKARADAEAAAEILRQHLGELLVRAS